MDQRNKKIPDQDNTSKWIIVVLLFLLIPPIGVYYVWKKREYFSRKLYLLLWFFGGWSMVQSLVFLTLVLPQMHIFFQEVGLVFPVYPSIILSFAILFSIVQIIFGFLVNKKIASLRSLPKNYLITGIILLLTGSVIIPFVIVMIMIWYQRALIFLL